MTDREQAREIERLAREINIKFARLAAARKAAGIAPGEPLLGLSLDEREET